MGIFLHATMEYVEGSDGSRVCFAPQMYGGIQEKKVGNMPIVFSILLLNVETIRSCYRQST